MGLAATGKGVGGFGLGREGLALPPWAQPRALNSLTYIRGPAKAIPTFLPHGDCQGCQRQQDDLWSRLRPSKVHPSPGPFWGDRWEGCP